MLRTSVQPLPSVQPPTFVRFLTFLYWLLSLLYFPTSLSPTFHTSLSPFFLHKSMRFLLLASISPTLWSLLAKVVNSNVCCSSVCFSLNYYTTILFVLHKCRNFFSVAHFGAAIVVFSARFGAAFWCFNFAFCWSTYVRSLSHLCLLEFVTFVFFTLRCKVFFWFHCHLFFSITSCAFSYYL